MADLASLEQSLNSSATEKAAFLRDPVAYLSGKGINLPQASQQALINQIQANPNLNPNSGWNVGVNVTIPF